MGTVIHAGGWFAGIAVLAYAFGSAFAEAGRYERATRVTKMDDAYIWAQIERNEVSDEQPRGRTSDTANDGGGEPSDGPEGPA